MKKLIKVFLAITTVFLLGFTSAHALPTFGFDSTGSDGPFDQVSGFKLLGTGGFGQEEENNPGGTALLDIWSETDFNTNTFTESFTLRLAEGLNSAGTTGFLYGGTNIMVDVDLNGTISNIQPDGSYTVNFSNAGSVARFYLDGNGNFDYDAGVPEVTIAELQLASSLPFNFEPSLLGGVAVSVDLAFQFITANPLYWDTAFEDLVNSLFMFTVTQGDLTLQDLEPDTVPPNGIQYQGWSVVGVDSALTVVPEPTTLFLFGAGLLGIAGIGRKRVK